MPELSSKLTASESFGAIEAVKTVADLFAPVSGNIVEINNALEESPDLINSDPYGSGWIIKVSVDSLEEYNNLLTNEDYEDFIE